MSGKNKKNKGFFLTEIIIASAIIGMLVAGLATSMYGFAKFNRYQLVKQQCIAAAQAQLDSITSTGKPIPDGQLKHLWPKLNINIENSEGTDQWKGLTLIEVTANGMSYSRQVKVKLSRYVLEYMPLENRE